MGTNASLTSANNVLKTLYPQSEIERLAYENNPLLGMVKKNTNFRGKNQVIALRYGTQMGRSAVFATASNNRTPNAYGAFTFTAAKDYVVGGIDTETIRASTDKGSLVAELSETFDGMTYAITRSLANKLYGNGGGTIGQAQGVGSGTYPGGIPGTTVTLGSNQFILTDPNQVVWFEVGQTLECATTDGTSGSRRTGQMIVTSVDRDNGVVTCTGGLVTGFAVNDYIFVQDDFGAALKGLDAWLPAVAPVAGDSFFGQDRSADTTRMAGVRWAGGGGPIEETLQSTMARLYREGGRPDKAFLNPVDLNSLVLSLNSRTVYNDVKSTTPGLGYKSVKIITQNGDLDVISDPNCKKGIAYLLQMDTWTLWSRDACPGFLNEDDIGKMLRDAGADSYQIRMGYFAQLVCNAPGYNARVAL